MKAFKEFSKTGVGRVVLVIGVIILGGISSVILNKLIEEINYKNISVVVAGQSDSTEKKIKKELSEMIKEYQLKYGGEYYVVFDSPVADEENAVEVNIFFNEDEIPDLAYSLPAVLYDVVLDYSSEYLSNPFIDISTKKRIDEGEEILRTKNGYDSADYMATKEATENPLKITEVTLGNRSGKYIDVNVTVMNQSGKDIDYVKIDLFYYDENGNEFRSDWTNDSATIRNGATQIITKMTESDFDRVSAKIDEFSYK